MRPAHLLDLESDVPILTATAAHRGTSFFPEKRGAQERDDYAATLLADWHALAALADTDDKRATLEAEFARYRAGYRAHFLAYLAAKSRIVSTMIAGPANFPVRRMEKANASERNRSDELTSYRDRALRAIRRTLRPEDAPIMAGDADAVTRLEAEIAAAEQNQQRMKDDNAAARKARTAPPWPSFTLTNAAARLRGMKERLAVIVRNKARRDEVITGAAGIRYEDDPPANRVRLYFPGKPSADVRARLKAAGFRWAPTIGAWQAYRNRASVMAARDFAGVGLAAVPACGADLDALGRGTDPCALDEGHEGGHKREPRCACHDGHHCDVSHDPAMCGCGQCPGAEVRP